MSKNKGAYWKPRAIERRLENKELKKRIKELTHSRDNWKTKCMHTKGQNKLYENELN
ncbi:hypothetical protein MNBD_IGNAVI01-1890, partial [hydrothermal vent metagenome]